jgi:predicted transcriptional regulator
MVIEKELLTNLGITEAEAWIVEILSDGQPHTQRDLERATDLELRQPQVSFVMRSLREFFNTKELASKSKGRPECAYTLHGNDLKRYLNAVIEIKEKEIAKRAESLANLKAAVKRL